MANQWLGLIAYWQGDFLEARTYYGRALAARDPNPDRKLLERFGDPSGYAASQFAPTAWALGELEHARELINTGTQRALESGHIGAIVDALFYKSYLEVWRGDPVATLLAAEALERDAQEHGIVQYLNEAELHSGWARGRIDDPVAGATQVRRVLAAFVDRSVRINLGFYSGLLAQLEAETLGADSALARIDEAFRLSEQVEHRCSLPFLHRLRGEILLKRDPANPAPGEEAFLAAIAIAKAQGARSYELLASLSLAKLYQSTTRPVDAHAVLAPALEGFSPTPEMPEIAEARALLAALAETDEVKAAVARRERRAKLQLGMATALFQSRGMQAPETRAAFEHVSVTAAETADPMEWLAILYGRWAGELARGDVRRMLEVAASMEPVAARERSGQGAVVARRVLGLSQYYAGDLAGADENMQWAIDHYHFDRDRALAVRFAHDPAVAARYYLACAKWVRGDIDAASRVVAEAKSLAERVDHPPTTVALYMIVAMLDCIHNDHRRARANAEKALALARDSNLALWRLLAEFPLSWATAASNGTRGAWDAAEASLASLWSTGTALLEGLGAYIAAGFADLGEFDRALAIVDQALSRSAEKGVAVYLSEGHRVRGEILFKRDASDPEPAERSLQTAIKIAREQGARSFELRASLSLAKLYQSTGRLAEAHAVLAPALEGFSPTPEMPEIAQAQALLVAIEAGAHVRHK